MGNLNRHMENLQCQLELERTRDRANPATSDETLVLRLHSKIMAQFYGRRSPAHNFKSHWICVCCFVGTALHPLHCGHVLCTPCVKGYGDCVNRYDYSIRRCPLHPDGTQLSYTIRFKPEFAGVRLLSLDGYVITFEMSHFSCRNFVESAYLVRDGYLLDSTGYFRGCVGDLRI